MNTPEATPTSKHDLPVNDSSHLIPSDAPTMRGTILLVEDDRSIRRYLEVILQRSGFTVITAEDGLEAMKAALAFTIDAVVTDAIMPHLNGYELCRFLRRHPRLTEIPVILLSGFERSDTAQEGDDCPNAYLTKPVRPDDLVNCLTQLLQ